MLRYQSNAPKGQRKCYCSTLGSGILEFGRLLNVAVLHIPTDSFD